MHNQVNFAVRALPQRTNQLELLLYLGGGERSDWQGLHVLDRSPACTAAPPLWGDPNLGTKRNANSLFLLDIK